MLYAPGMNILQRIVTPAFIAFQSHCWFAYAIVFTFNQHWSIAAMLVAAGVKEFYIDKHFELSQTFRDNMQDFTGYLTGILLAICARHSL